MFGYLAVFAAGVYYAPVVKKVVTSEVKKARKKYGI